MDPVIIARWQFGITTVYHYLFVPITIALSMLVAIFQTLWYKRNDERFLQLTKFYGKLFLINFALGVVTGIVQEFQFGMNWSEYSRFVGDIFGAPLALEALIAFFLESTFIGLWIFGWDTLPKKLHLLSIYLAAIGTMVSAVFILAANSWMQNPVGAKFSIENGRAEMIGISSILDLLTNPVFLGTFPHVIAGAYMTAGGLVCAIAGWHLAKLNKKVKTGDISVADSKKDISTYRWATKFGAIVLLVASFFTIASGHYHGVVMTQVQPAKIAAAEGIQKTETNAGFSIVKFGSGKDAFDVKVPGLLSFLTGNKKVQGLDDLNAAYKNGKVFLQNDGTVNELQKTIQQALKDGKISPDKAKNFVVSDIKPNVPLNFWTFRFMIGLGFLGMLLAILALVKLRKGNNPLPTKSWMTMMMVLPFLPLFANSFGWMFAEFGRQPWIVNGVLPVAAAVSPSVQAGEVLFSTILYTALYGALAVVEFGLFFKFAGKGLPEVGPVEIRTDEDAPLNFAY